MPYKNPNEHFYPLIGIKVQKKDSAFYDALQKAAEESEQSLQQFFRQAAREKLIRDGYLPPENK